MELSDIKGVIKLINKAVFSHVSKEAGEYDLESYRQ